MNLEQDIVTHIKGTVKEDVKVHKQKLKILTKFIKNENVEPYFTIRISSAWRSYGEKSVESSGKELNRAIKRAIIKFKKINNRSDVQGDISVYLKIDKDTYRLVPQEYYIEIYEKYRKYKPKEK